MKQLSYADYMQGDIVIKKEDEDVVIQNFKENIEMTYDEFGRVFDEAETYIADLEEVTKVKRR